jgi:hypothetical protein
MKCRQLNSDGRVGLHMERLPDPVVIENGGILIDDPKASEKEVEELNDQVYEDEIES